MEYIKIYLEENGEITEKVIDVNEVSHYVGLGWTLKKPEKKEEKTEKVEKVFSKKDHKKEKNKNV